MDLSKQFSKSLSKSGKICEPNQQTSRGHMSNLPIELIIYIFKWVLSSDLDIKCLETCAEVCRGFYLASRSSDIWRSICLQTWGIPSYDELSSHIQNQIEHTETEWRTYFFSNPRIHFHGYYFGDISYIREGERGFEDHELYRAWHVVQYYRLLRFYPRGKVVMVTTSEEPSKAVESLFKSKGILIPGQMNGRYHTINDRVICQIVKDHTNDSGDFGKRIEKQGTENTINFEWPKQEFYFELKIQGKQCDQLHWLKYTISSIYEVTGKTEHTEVDVKDANNYPPLQFSKMYGNHLNHSVNPLKESSG